MVAILSRGGWAEIVTCQAGNFLSPGISCAQDIPDDYFWSSDVVSQP